MPSTLFNALNNYCSNIFEGARPGYQKAYVLNYEEILENKLEFDIIKPLLKVELIEPYEIMWDKEGIHSLYIILPLSSLSYVGR